MAEATLQGIWTQKGLDKETAFRAGGERKKLTHVAVGDGNGSIPLVSAAQTGLVNEVWRGLANAVMVNPDDPTDLLVDVVIPNNVGGFWIREWGIFDEDGDLVAVGPHDEMHKPLISTGQAAEFLERFHLPSANATFVEIKIASQALATQQYVESKISEHDADAEAHETLARKSVQIKAGTGLMGGGTLEADRTLTVSYGTAAGTACQGNDARLSNARTPTAHKATHKTGGTDALTPADIGAVPTTVQVIAGTGLSGGGSLTANRTLTVKYGTGAGTACQGNDARVTASEAFRLSMIGVPRYWRSTTLPAGHVWANGDLALFADWPELKKIYDAGGFAGMLLAYNANSATIAANLGKWRPNAANPTGLYVPNLSEQFFRAWTGAGESGKYNAPGLPDIIGKYGQIFARPEVAEGPFAGSDIIAENLQGGTDSAIDYLVTVRFRASAANPTYGASATVMPSSINLPIILYMGIAA